MCLIVCGRGLLQHKCLLFLHLSHEHTSCSSPGRTNLDKQQHPAAFVQLELFIGIWRLFRQFDDSVLMIQHNYNQMLLRQFIWKDPKLQDCFEPQCSCYLQLLLLLWNYLLEIGLSLRKSPVWSFVSFIKKKKPVVEKTIVLGLLSFSCHPGWTCPNCNATLYGLSQFSAIQACTLYSYV